MNKLLKTAMGIGIAALATASISGPSYAGDLGKKSSSVIVSYADLDTSNTSGARALLHRINAAAKRVCGSKPNIRDFYGLQAYKTCMREAVDTAVAELGNANVTALHANAGGLQLANR